MDLKSFTKHLIDVSTPQMLKDWIKVLGNKVEELEFSVQTKDQIIERLEAENRKLKGLPAKPQFADKTTELEGKEAEGIDKEKKPNPGKGHPRRKKHDLAIDLNKQCEVNPDDLDSTFEYKGTRKVIVQDILFQRNNICFELEKYYSAEHQKTVEADLPPGYEGGYFGPNVIAFILCSYYEGDVTIKKIWKILDAIGIKISLKQINRIINHQPDDLVNELDDARVAGIEKAGYQQIDDTGAKIGIIPVNAFSTVVCNPFFTNIVTGFSKSRFAAVMALAGGSRAPLYKLNDHAIFVFFQSQGSVKVQLILEHYSGEKVYTEGDLNKLFAEDNFAKLSVHILREIRTAMLVGAYYDGHLGVTGKALVSDDAGQFNNIFDIHVLCWYHEFRHYKEILPVLEMHQVLMREFFDEAKLLYKGLKEWIFGERRLEAKNYLLKWFNDFFTKETGFTLLDERKRLSFAKIDKLLAPLFLDFIVPLHNNESERDIRGRAIKKKISLFNRTFNGARAWDLHISLKQTCRKLRVSYHKFLMDRITGAAQIPQLCRIIQAI
jgi:hypothetical protein